MTDVETTQEASTGTEGTQKAEATPVENVDYEFKLSEVLTAAEQLALENQKLAEERDNYQKGMLAAKKKIKALKDDGYAIDDEDDDKSKVVEERLAKIETLVTQALQQKDKEVDSTTAKLNKTISELKVSLANRAQVSSAPSGSGSNLDKPDATPSKWTKEQLEYFKKRGLDPDKVWANLPK